jgi:hypothetical protein
MGGWVGLIAGLDTMEKRKNLPLLRNPVILSEICYHQNLSRFLISVPFSIDSCLLQVCSV